MAMATNADQWTWRRRRISAVRPGPKALPAEIHIFRAVTSILSQRLLHKMTDSRAQFSKRGQGTRYWASDTSVKCICRNIGCALGEWSLRQVNFYLEFHWVTRQWRRTMTNGSDVKFVFPRCLRNLDDEWDEVFCHDWTLPPGPLKWVIALTVWELPYGNCLYECRKAIKVCSWNVYAKCSLFRTIDVVGCKCVKG